MDKFFLYLPIETKVRELEAKLLLSIEALKNDYIIIIGSDLFLKQIKNLPKGIILHKDALNIREKYFKEAKSSGHKVVVLDEEGSVVFDWPSYLRKRVWPNTVDYVDKILCWGKNQYDAINDWKSNLNKRVELSITGHSRIDLLRVYNQPKEENIILINTHLSLCNFLDSADNLLKMLKNNKVIQSKEDLDRHCRHVNYKKKLMEYYIDLLKELSRIYPTYKIILRPHPSENENTWIKLAKNLSNVYVTKKYSVNYWIEKAKVVIHTGCTTAIETLISDKVAIAFKPIENKEFEVKLPDSISIQVHSTEECLEVIEKVIEERFNKKSYLNNSKNILQNNISIDDFLFSYQRIFNEIDKLKVEKHKINIKSIKSLYRFINIKLFIKKIRNFILRKKSVNEKFEITSCIEIEKTLNKLKESIDEDIDIHVQKISKNVFILSNNK